MIWSNELIWVKMWPLAAAEHKTWEECVIIPTWTRTQNRFSWRYFPWARICFNVWRLRSDRFGFYLNFPLQKPETHLWRCSRWSRVWEDPRSRPAGPSSTGPRPTPRCDWLRAAHDRLPGPGGDKKTQTRWCFYPSCICRENPSQTSGSALKRTNLKSTSIPPLVF